MTITMRGAVEHPLVQKIIAYQLAMTRQDFTEGAKIFAPDVVYTVPVTCARTPPTAAEHRKPLAWIARPGGWAP